MTTVSRTAGRAVSGWIVLEAAVILKSIVSPPGAPLASMIAWRSEPGPALFVLLTVNVVSSVRPSRHSATGDQRCPNGRSGRRLRREGRRRRNQAWGGRGG